MPPSPPSSDEIRDVAHQAVKIFEDHELSSCLFGSAACELYGRNRAPNDVDLIVMADAGEWSAEELKDMLVTDSYGDFYTQPARTPGATYKVLYYRLRGNRRSCKVDILLPGTLNIPFVRPKRIVWIEGLPVLPFLVLLILKVQGWHDHRHSNRQYMRAKVSLDVRDVNEMLGIGRRRGEDLAQEQWIPKDFLQHGFTLIEEYIDHHGNERRWELLGL